MSTGEAREERADGRTCCSSAATSSPALHELSAHVMTQGGEPLVSSSQWSMVSPFALSRQTRLCIARTSQILGQGSARQAS